MSLDWKKCVICQQSTRETFKCPLNSNGPGLKLTGKRINLALIPSEQCKQLLGQADGLPVELKFGDDVDVDCLCCNHGSWHKSYHLKKFSLSKLQKAQERTGRKRNDSRTDEEKRPAPKCRKLQSLSEERSQCLFCLGGDDGDKLQCFSVLETDRSIPDLIRKF